MVEEVVTKKFMVGRCNMTIIRRICLLSATHTHTHTHTKEEEKLNHVLSKGGDNVVI